MTSRKDQLWELISNHPMPADATGRSFAEQLMAEHRIKRETAGTAIEEYRKFLYLCATRDDRNVPSKAVDLVWHQHMQHSRDYWDGLCAKIGKPIHHSPGGEGTAHLEDYKATVEAYRLKFGTPPRGIWRQQTRAGSIGALLFTSLFLAYGLNMLSSGDAPPLFALAFTAIPLLAIAKILYGMTPGGEYSLTFEAGDPFADNDAGDCGSGDGGGCGD
ncbi:glycine-rich domain-containing protein-like [Gymnodinialimonas hymeniacidonis]|uniref:glycine-rich domain-containing protein n=1 Tax=Gymnodinialimonas hymeniacidonis TaxID=3126508 RepID=UPI0034C65875